MPMRCPSCLSALPETTEACPSCGFTLAALDIVFGTIPRNAFLLNDLGLVFDAGQQVRLRGILAEFSRGFPGLHVSMVTMELSPQFKPREYLFWLVNRGRFAPIEHKLERSLFVVLFIDTRSRSVLLTTGLGLHEALPEETLQGIIQAALPQFQKGNAYRGSVEIFAGLRRQLRSHVSGSSRPAAPLPPQAAAKGEFQDAL